MKTARLSLFLVWSFALSVFGAAPVSLLVETNGALRAPTTFFSVNSAAITALSSGVYQPVDADLTAFAGISAVAGDVIYHNGTNWVRLPKGTDGQTLQLSSGFPTWATVVGGGAGDVTLAGTNAFTGPNSFAGTTTFNGAANLNGTTTISNLTVPGTLSAAAFSTATPLGFASGGHGATNAAGARTALGLDIGSDVQAWSAYLQQLATVSWSSGDVPYFDGSNLTNLATTAAGRTLLAAANAAAQWDAIKSDALQSGAYDEAAWDGVTGKAVTPDQVRDIIQGLAIGSNAIVSVTTPLSLSNGVLSINTAGLGGGGGGYTYISTNVGGAFQSRTDGTNWTILSTTVSSNYAPSAAGRFIEGGWSTVISNYSGTSANIYLNISANGTTVFRDAVSLNNTMRGQNSSMWLVRESDTTAAIITLGSQAGPAAIGQGDFGGTAAGALTISTNVAWNWATNNTLLVELQCDTSTSTNDALGMRNAWSYLRAENAASSGSGDVVGPASSTDSVVALYDGTTGKLLKDGTLTEAAISAHLTEAEASVLYQATNAALTALAANSQLYQATNAALTALASNPSLYQATNTALTALAGNPSLYQSTNANLTALAGAGSTGTGAFVRADSPTITGTWAFDDFTANTINVLSNLYAVTVAYGAGWNGSSNVPTRNDVYDEMELRAPKASPALTGDPTAPTASANDNDTSIATTAYVQAEETALKALNLWQATNSALTSLSAGTSAGLASALSDETGTGVAAFATAPTFTGATLNGSVVFGQSDLAAHSDLTNFVVNPTVAPYQVINGILTNALPWVRILHATNVAAGRQTTVLFCAGTNASVNVFLNPQFACNTNSVTVTTGQILPISFYGYGPDNTNVIATMGTPYTR